MIDVFICRFLSAARYPWIKHVCSDILRKVDASLFLVWIRINRDALPFITGNGCSVAVVQLTGHLIATGAV